MRLPQSTRPEKVEKPKVAYRRRLKHSDDCMAGLEDEKVIPAPLVESPGPPSV